MISCGWHYSVDRLVLFETCDESGAAIAREKMLKKWRRDWKINLLEPRNPDWVDLDDGMTR